MTERRRAVYFDGVVTLGNVLTLVALLVSAGVFVAKIDKRLALLEDQFHRHIDAPAEYGHPRR